MGADFVERLRFIREEMGISGRKLSLDLGLNVNAWATYESGNSLPGSAVLETLCRRGVNVNWLLTGIGQPWLKPNPTKDLSSFVQEHNQELWEKLGLGRLALIAARSKAKVKIGILTALADSAQDGLSVEGLEKVLGVTRDEVVALLLELVEENLVEEVRVGDSCVYKNRNDCWSISTSNGDMAQVVLDAVAKLVLKIFPTAVQVPSSAMLLEGTLYVQDGRAWMKEVLAQMRSTCTAEEPGRDSVTFVLGASIE